MKRKRAITLLAGFVLLVAAYLIWCARPFYLKPPLGFQQGVSEEMRQYISAWYEELPFFEPEDFEWSRYAEMLRSPYESRVEPVSVGKIGGGIFRDEEMVIAVHRSRAATVFFQRDRFGWRPPIIQCEGPPGFTNKLHTFPPDSPVLPHGSLPDHQWSSSNDDS